VKKFEEINNEIIRNVERQPTKKRPHVSANAISSLFVVKNLSKRMLCSKKTFCKTLAFLL
jgi:hypothetical protein